MIRAIIIDDEETNRETLNELIVLHCPQVEILAKCDSAAAAYKAIQQYEPDLLFLDIEMPGESGFDLLEKTKKHSLDVIFITAHGHYALKAIKFSALDYLLKPINTAELKEAIKKVVEKKNAVKNDGENINVLLQNLNGKEQFNKIAIPDIKGSTFVTIEDILRFQGEGSYTAVYLKNGERLISTKTLKEYEMLLRDTLFLRIHHSHIINLRHVKRFSKELGGYIIMTDNSEVEISRRRKQSFLELLAQV